MLNAAIVLVSAGNKVDAIYDNEPAMLPLRDKCNE
jgi:hypothetical protein